MKIGVTSQNFRTITGHAGKARRFMIFEVAPDGQVTLAEKHDLRKQVPIHEHPLDAAHPLDGVEVLLTGSCGDGFKMKMAGRGIRVLTTAETDPVTAITTLLSGGELAPAVPDHDHNGCGCA